MSKKTQYWFDTEFIEDGCTIDLISVGIVCEDGRAYYAQNHNCDFKKAGDWVWRNVFTHLTHFAMKGERSCRPMNDGNSMSMSFPGKCSYPDCKWRKEYEIRDEVREFMDVEKFGKPEIWGYYAAYDWVAFCQLFGTMMDLPKGFPMLCMDVKQLCESIGNPRLPEQDAGQEHHALNDAQWTRDAWTFCMNKLRTETT